MTVPNAISQFNRSGDDEQQLEITDKKLIEGIPLVITDANHRNSKQYGPFWLIEATRTDTGEVIAFVGSKVIDKVMTSVKEAKAFPVAAVITKVKADNPQGYYWDLTDPPAGTIPTNTGAPDRIAQVMEIIGARGLTVDDVTLVIAELAGPDKKVRDLDDESFQKLLDRLSSMGAPQDEPPLEEPPF